MFDTWISNLVAKHSKSGILLDSNLLFLQCVGIINPGYVGVEKGTREYTLEDLKVLVAFLARFRCILTTPNILTETSNLSGRLREDVRLLFRVLLRDKIVELLEERYINTYAAVAHSIFTQSGVADAVIGVIADEGLLVLTDDLDLSILITSRGQDCIHYTSRLRPLALSLE